MSIKVITIIFALMILLFVVELVRKEKLTFKYAFAWLIVSTLAICFSIFDKTLFHIAYLVGFELPSNFIFFSLLSVLIVLSLMMTVFLCQQDSKNNKIAQKVGMLENELSELKKNIG